MAENRAHTFDRRLFSVTCVVEALLLLGFLFLLARALRPDFSGGRFIVVVLFAGIGLLGFILTRDLLGAFLTDHTGGAGSGEAALLGREWGVALRGFALVVSLFGLILVFGILPGMAIVALVILRFHIRVSYAAALGGAVVLGAIIPVAFAWAVGITLWPGVIPEIIPGWLGGGILPPL